ncbi:MAG: hypothetical protein ACYC6N_20155, partial [Pirellulaceae bacterium]
DDPVPAPNFESDESILLNDHEFPSLGPAHEVKAVKAVPHHYDYRGYAQHSSRYDEKCCAESFGGFGCLWESYCADRQRGCRTAGCGTNDCGTEACRQMPCYPSFRSAVGLSHKAHRSCRPTRRAREVCTSCRTLPCDGGCDGGSSMIIGPGELTPQEVREPPGSAPMEPERALEPPSSPDPPDNSIEPDPPPSLDVPEAQGASSNSSRRSWLNRRAS